MPRAINEQNFLNIGYYNLYIQILFLIILIYLLYYVLRFIVNTLSRKNCRRDCRRIISEGFISNFESSKKYFDTLSKKCDVIADKISDLSISVDDIQIKAGGLVHDICYITSQIDDSLAGNYASNVPEDEKEYPIEEQKQRAAKRKTDSVKYVTNLKKSFVETHDNVPLLECFTDSSMGDEEKKQLAYIRENLNSKIDDTNASLDQFNNSMLNLQKDFSKGMLERYYTTLNYNDKYIKQMNRAILTSQSGEEGFDNKIDSIDVFDFKPLKKVDTSDPDSDPSKRVNDLEENYKNSEAMFFKLLKTYNKYNNTTIKQTQELKQVKMVVIDKDEQNRQIKSNIGNVTNSL